MYVCVSLPTSCERPPADGSSPFSLGRLSLGELQPETGVLLLLGDESGERQAMCEFMIMYLDHISITLNFITSVNHV